MAAVLVWVKDSEAASIRGNPNCEKYGESDEASPNCPFFASAHRNCGKHDASQGKNRSQRNRPRGSVCREHCRIKMEVRACVCWCCQRTLQEQ